MVSHKTFGLGLFTEGALQNDFNRRENGKSAEKEKDGGKCQAA
jgi:hypothetical protein